MSASLADYIKQSRAAGYTDQQIREALLDQGWDARSLAPFFSPPAPPAPSSSATENTGSHSPIVGQTVSVGSHTMWDAFEHVLMFLSLYVLSGAIAFVLHGVVDNTFPDPSLPNRFSYGVGGGYGTYASPIRWGIATIIVSLPLFILMFLDITKRTLRLPQLRQLSARKILTYLTLIATFAILLWQLIRIVFTFLDGNFAVGFVLHFLTTSGISGLIFWYYVLQVRTDRSYGN